MQEVSDFGAAGKMDSRMTGKMAGKVKMMGEATSKAAREIAGKIAILKKLKYDLKTEEEVEIYLVKGGEKAFLVINPRTIEVRTDGQLGRLLQERYESVMESRYFGRGGIEIVMSGQLGEDEIEDLVRLSYNLTVGD